MNATINAENQMPSENPNRMPAIITPIATNPAIIRYRPQLLRSARVIKATAVKPRKATPVMIPAVAGRLGSRSTLMQM